MIAIPSPSRVLAYWKLAENPFDIAGKPGGVIAVTAGLLLARDFLVGTAGRGGVSALLGNIGDGKSTAVAAAMRVLSKRPREYLVVKPLTLATNAISPAVLLRLVFEAHGSYLPRSASTAGRLRALIDLVEAVPSQTVIVLDEAHFLGTGVIRLVKEIGEITPKISVLLIGHAQPLEVSLRTRDSLDLWRRLECGRICTPVPMTADDGGLVIGQRREACPACPAFPQEVIAALVAARDNPLGFLRLAWECLVVGAMDGATGIAVPQVRRAVMQVVG